MVKSYSVPQTVPHLSIRIQTVPQTVPHKIKSPAISMIAGLSKIVGGLDETKFRVSKLWRVVQKNASKPQCLLRVQRILKERSAKPWQRLQTKCKYAGKHTAKKKPRKSLTYKAFVFCVLPCHAEKKVRPATRALLVLTKRVVTHRLFRKHPVVVKGLKPLPGYRRRYPYCMNHHKYMTHLHQ